MANNQPRRPAQMKPGQLDLIESRTDIPFDLEIAHATAYAVVPLGGNEIDDEASERIRALIDSDGIDALAETWVDAPSDSLPGILWRGYLLAEWIRRFPDEVAVRLRAADIAAQELRDDGELPAGFDTSAIPDTKSLGSRWSEVFEGDFRGDFGAILADSAVFTCYIAQARPEWISSDEHPLATLITRRDDGIARVSEEFSHAYDLAHKHLLL